jgi:hypothetical protein
MEQAPGQGTINDNSAADARAAPRFTLLLRAAKLLAPQGQFLCVIRDVSATGVSLRGFHALPEGEGLQLELQSGARYALEQVWNRGTEAGYRFGEAVEVAELLAEPSDYPKRPLRLDIGLPLRIELTGQVLEGELVNISQQGACIECATFLAIDQPLRLVSRRLPEIHAKVRWRDHHHYGLAFDTTFDLRRLAQVSARVQCPSLLAVQPDRD